MYTHLQKLVNSFSDVCGVFNWQTQTTFWPNEIRIQADNRFLFPMYSASCHKVRAIATCWHYYVSPIYITLRIFWPVHNITQYIKHRKTQSTKQYTPKLLVKNASEGNKYKQFWAEFKSYFSMAYNSSPLTSQYMLSVLIFVVQNKNLFLTNNEYHNLDIRQRNNLYLPQANLTIYQKGVYYSGIKIFNNLPLEIKNVAGKKKKKFKLLWKNFYTLTHFTQLKSTLVKRELSTVPQDFIVVAYWFKILPMCIM